MSTTSISVVLATYNGANYLLAQLDSLLKQTLLPDEIIFSDVCSTDATELIISEFIKLNKGKIDFKYYVNNGLSGVYYNFENALIHVSGDIIFLCDQDDIWFEKKLEFHKKKYEELNCISVISDALFVDESLKSLGLTKLESIRSKAKKQNFVQGCCVSFKKSLLKIILPFPKINNLTHDEWIYYCTLAYGTRHVDNKVLQYYRRHGRNDSLSLANGDQNIFNIKRFIKILNYKHILKNYAIFTELEKRCSGIELNNDFVNKSDMAKSRFKFLMSRLFDFRQAGIYLKNKSYTILIVDIIRKLTYKCDIF